MKKARALKIYVSGPISSPNPVTRMANIYRAIHIGVQLIKRGHNPFIPHLYGFVDDCAKAHTGKEIEYEAFMRLDFAFLDACDAFFLIAPSPGANRELERAQKRNIPVFRKIDEVPWVHIKKQGIDESSDL